MELPSPTTVFFCLENEEKCSYKKPLPSQNCENRSVQKCPVTHTKCRKIKIPQFWHAKKSNETKILSGGKNIFFVGPYRHTDTQTNFAVSATRFYNTG